eukprot:187276-Chlamydomonas_euryale.AAC.1
MATAERRLRKVLKDRPVHACEHSVRGWKMNTGLPWRGPSSQILIFGEGGGQAAPRRGAFAEPLELRPFGGNVRWAGRVA